jgi:hypothetical protein
MLRGKTKELWMVKLEISQSGSNVNYMDKQDLVTYFRMMFLRYFQGFLAEKQISVGCMYIENIPTPAKLQISCISIVKYLFLTTHKDTLSPSKKTEFMRGDLSDFFHFRIALVWGV